MFNYQEKTDSTKMADFVYNMVECILNSTNSLKLNFIFNDIKYISE